MLPDEAVTGLDLNATYFLSHICVDDEKSTFRNGVILECRGSVSIISSHI
jgi:hypothetical protein